MNYTEMDRAATISITSADESIMRRSRRKKTVYSTYVPSHRISRYNNTFQTFFSIGKNKEKSIDDCSILSFITFHWVFKLLNWNSNEWRTQEGSEADSCIINSSRLNGIFDDERTKKGKQRLSMLSVVWRFIRTRMIFTCLLYILASIFSMLGLVLFLPKILCSEDAKGTTSSESPPCVHSWEYMAALIATELIAILLYSSSHAINLRTAIKLRSACFASLYRQSMITSITYKISSWQLVTHLLSDGQHVQDFILTLPSLISSPIILICCMLFAGAHLQLWGYLSVAVVFLFFPLFILIACLSKNVQHRAFLYSDQRIHLLEEFIVNNICVKFFKREQLFESSISRKREKELQHMEKAGFYDSLCFSCVQMQPLMSMSVIFVVYGLFLDTNQNRDTQISEFAAVCILIMTNLKFSLENFWHGLSSFVIGLSSLHKYKRIMIYEVINFKRKEYLEKNIYISMKGACFQWTRHQTLDSHTKIIFSSNKDETLISSNEKQHHDTLKDLNIFIKENNLIGICGLPGSGKSSFLKAVMGLLIKTKGELKTNGNFAYVQHDPVILSESLKNNILFGNEMNAQRYYHTIHQCQIAGEHFMGQYENDEIIDQKCLTLEQKQQIGLARALYSNADIILLDNPLSAMEPSKKSNIFQCSIFKILQERAKKIVLIVTEDMNLLEQCDEVYMMQNGAILQQGHHLQLKEEPDYMEYIYYLSKQINACREKSKLFETTADVPKDDERRRLYSSSNTIFESSNDTIHTITDKDTMILMDDDHKQSTNTYMLFEYISHFGSCCSVFILVVAQIINASFISFLPIFFLISLQHLMNEIVVLEIYYGAFFFMLFAGILLNWYINKKMYSAALLFHDEFMQKLYKSTLGFMQSKCFRIISSLVHLQLTDVDIPRLIYNILLNIFIALMTICVIVFVSPWHLIIVVFILIIMILAATLVRRTAENYTQMEINYFNCIYTKIVTMLKARPIIQAYDKVNDFSKTLYVDYDNYITNIYLVNAAKSWLNLVIQSCSVILLAVISCVTLFISKWCPLIQFDNKVQFNISCAALAIVCTLQLCYALQKLFLLYINAGSSLDTLTEIQDFKMKIDQEIEIESMQKLHRDEPFSISFQNVSIHALADVSFNIAENDKIGFVGLTSSERKAIISVLYKLTDNINNYTGLVEINQIDISKISYNELRSCIMIIPSEPYLFNTTITKMFIPEKEIGNILNKFLIWDRIKRLPDKLESNVDQMLTFEEKQILLLAQAYQKQSPIVIIEDFVNGSNLEYILNTDLQKKFPKSTIIIFANDMSGLEDCNRVIRFNDGKLQNIKSSRRSIKNQLALMTTFDTLETEF